MHTHLERERPTGNRLLRGQHRTQCADGPREDRHDRVSHRFHNRTVLCSHRLAQEVEVLQHQSEGGRVSNVAVETR